MNEKKSLKERICSLGWGWDSIKILGSSRLIRSSYFWIIVVPLLASFSNQFDDPITFELGFISAPFSIPLPFSWVRFYFAALAFSAASLIYSLRCPNIVKGYSNFSDYYTSGAGYWILLGFMGQSRDYMIDQYPQLEGQMVNALKNSDEEADAGVVNSDTKNYDLLVQELRKVERKEMGDLFQLTVEASIHLYPKIRLLLSILYGIGLFFTAWVFFENVCTVYTVAFPGK